MNWDVYGRQYWNELAAALSDAEKGDGELLLQLARGWWGRLPDGSYDPGIEANMVIAAVDQAWPKATQPYLRAIRRAYSESKYLWWIGGSTSGIFRQRDRGSVPNPHQHRLPRTVRELTIRADHARRRNTHDPLTPYPGAKAEVRQLGNARLLTMRGYTHTAYGGASPCIDRAVEAYLKRGILPPEGKTCTQRVPFEPYSASKQGKASTSAAAVERPSRLPSLP